MMAMLKRILIFAAMVCVLCAAKPLQERPGEQVCCRRAECRQSGFKAEELSLIRTSPSPMRVLTVNSPEDLSTLRSKSRTLEASALLSSDYERLCSLMVETVRHPSQDGVGIAGPQVGLNLKVVAVQRFDKEPVLHDTRKDYPFEVYANIRIVEASPALVPGPEGCLSVPDKSGTVMRSDEIVIEYTDLDALKKQTIDQKGSLRGDLPTRREKISGFTAVIFQHEIDHLDGILYIDKMNDYPLKVQ